MSRFLLVSLNIDAILQETTIRRRRQKLSAMTDGLGLGSAYSETLSRIKRQGGEKSRLGMAALMWISHSERPLKVDELCHALGVELGSLDLDGDNVPSIATLLTCCQGLVSVDVEASTIRLIHFTLQEYLRAHPELFGKAHATIAETCLIYLNSPQVKALSTSPSRDLRGTPFLEYSSLYWGMHAKRELSESAKRLALKLFDDYSNHISIEILFDHEKPGYFEPSLGELFLFSGLHCASFFGIVEIVTFLVEAEGCDINQTDCTGSTPLVWAASNGHEGVVKILLTRDGVNPGKVTSYNETPLWWAAYNEHEGIVKILLGRDDTDPDKPNADGESPLWSAAHYGKERLVKILLGRDDVNPDQPNYYGMTPLSIAAMSGHEGIVKILLGRDDVNPNSPDRDGKTALLRAAEDGKEGPVRLLLGRHDVNFAQRDKRGWSPLMCAVLNQHEEVVEILLGSLGKPR